MMGIRYFYLKSYPKSSIPFFLITYKYTLTTFRDWLTGFARTIGVTLDGDILSIPGHLGEGFLRVVDLPSGQEALLMDFTLKKDLLVERDQTGRGNECYVFCCDDAEHIRKMFVEIDEDRMEKRDLSFKAMYLMSFLSDLSQFASAGSHIGSVRVIISAEWLGRYLKVDQLGDVLKRYLDLKAQSVHVKDLDFESAKLLNEILHPPPAEEMLSEPTYIQNRIMLMLENFFTWMHQQMSVIKLNIRMTREEIEGILAVEGELVKNLSNAPTIAQLAKQAALSPSKLKKQFKDVFGLPIYEHFQKVRMTRARDLLLEGGRSVKEVGMELGYSNLSNFSLAFRKVFDVLPSVMSKAASR
jgi:AraC-like DNA-binding protein